MISPGARQQRALSHLITTAQFISLQAMLSTCTTFFFSFFSFFLEGRKERPGKKEWGRCEVIVCDMEHWAEGRRHTGDKKDNDPYEAKLYVLLIIDQVIYF